MLDILVRRDVLKIVFSLSYNEVCTNKITVIFGLTLIKEYGKIII